MMMKFKKVIATVAIIIATLAITVVPCFAAFSSFGYESAYLENCNAAFDHITLSTGVGDLYISGNSLGSNTSYVDLDDFYANSLYARYELLHQDQSTIGNVETFSGNGDFMFDNVYSQMVVTYADIYNVDTIGDYYSGFSFSTVPMFYEPDINGDIPHFTFTNYDDVINVSLKYTFGVYEPLVRDDGSAYWELVLYHYQRSITGASVNPVNRTALWTSANNMFSAFIEDTGYSYNAPVQISASCDVTFGTPGDIDHLPIMFAISGDWYRVSEDDLDLPLDYSNVVNQIDLLGWLPRTIDGFLSVELFGDVTIGTIFLIGISIPALLAVLRMLGGVG